MPIAFILFGVIHYKLQRPIVMQERILYFFCLNNCRINLLIKSSPRHLDTVITFFSYKGIEYIDLSILFHNRIFLNLNNIIQSSKIY